MSEQQSHRPHLRFYIFMVTLVVGGLFFLLFMNEDDSSGSGIISAITGYSNFSDEQSPKITEEDLNQQFEELVGTTQKISRDVPLSLVFNRIPSVDKEAKISEVQLEFDDLTTTIMVNGDKLELKNLQEAKLSIEEFSGMVNFGSAELSLSGTAKKIEVNGIAFSSEKELPIVFQGLDYRHLHLSDIELKDLELAAGDGTLQVGEKLQYTLTDEELKMLYFKGVLDIDKRTTNSTSLSLDGDVRGLYVGGDLLSFTLR